MPKPDTPAIVAARRSAARTGLIASVAFFLLCFALNAWVLVNDLHHHRAITLPLVGFGAIAVGLFLTALRWKRRMTRYPKP